MKKTLCAILCLFMLICSVSVSAAGTGALLCTLHKEDMSGNAYMLFLMGCTGHYNAENDTVTLYITNMSAKDAEFQVHVGYSGDAGKKVTSIASGFVKLGAGVTAKFELSGLYDVPEKANDELGYVPDSHLSGKSVLRIQTQGLEDGDSFKISGIDSYSGARNTYYKEFATSSIIQTNSDLSELAEAKKVIIDEQAEDDKPFGWTLKQPSDEFIDGFTVFIAVSAILCAGGVVIYSVSIILKRRHQHD